MNPVYDFFSFLSFFFLEESGRVARLLVGLACLNCSILFIFFFFFFLRFNYLEHREWKQSKQYSVHRLNIGIVNVPFLLVSSLRLTYFAFTGNSLNFKLRFFFTLSSFRFSRDIRTILYTLLDLTSNMSASIHIACAFYYTRNN